MVRMRRLLRLSGPGRSGRLWRAVRISRVRLEGRAGRIGRVHTVMRFVRRSDDRRRFPVMVAAPDGYGMIAPEGHHGKNEYGDH